MFSELEILNTFDLQVNILHASSFSFCSNLLQFTEKKMNTNKV